MPPLVCCSTKTSLCYVGLFGFASLVSVETGLHGTSFEINILQGVCINQSSLFHEFFFFMKMDHYQLKTAYTAWNHTEDVINHFHSHIAYERILYGQDQQNNKEHSYKYENAVQGSKSHSVAVRFSFPFPDRPSRITAGQLGGLSRSWEKPMECDLLRCPSRQLLRDFNNNFV